MAARSPAWVVEIRAALALGLIVALGAYLGILSRPLGQLAALWPANAMLLGVLLRFPALATRCGWLGAIAGYVAVDLITGSSLLTTVWLTGANLAGVATGYALLSRLDPAHRRLALPLSVPYLGLCIAAAAAAAAAVAALLDPTLFGGNALTSWVYWFVTEIVNYMAVLPVVLMLPHWAAGDGRPRGARALHALKHLLPAIALVLLCMLGIVVGGPGALAFPVPALLWCALRYNVFATAVLNLLFSSWTLVALSQDFVPSGLVDINSRNTQLSLRLGLMLVGWGPLTVASVMAGRNALLRTMRRLANHDQLTGLLNRRAFREVSQQQLATLMATQRPVGVLMLDIDHFKSVNDRHGHAAGDAVLVTFALRTARVLPEGAVFSRLGGEEFAILLPGHGVAQALQVAEAVRSACAATAVPLDQGVSLTVTVSIGCHVVEPAVAHLEALLQQADRALYRAKAAGRNRVESSERPQEPALVQ